MKIKAERQGVNGGFIPYYAGIGARKTPQDILDIMTALAVKLSDKYTLRSGGAGGADQAFQKGVKAADIYLPWRDFELGNQLKFPQHRYYPIEKDDTEAEESVNLFHPNGSKLKDSVRAMMRRNFRQIVGKDGNNSKFVVCWTADGEASGGTGQAIRIAEHFRIPVFNLKVEDDLKRIEKFLLK